MKNTKDELVKTKKYNTIINMINVYKIAGVFNNTLRLIKDIKIRVNSMILNINVYIGVRWLEFQLSKST